MRAATAVMTPNALGVERSAGLSPFPQDTRVGPGSLAGFPDLVARLAPSSVMLVTGGASYMRSGASALVEPALASLNVTRVSGVAANPKIADVERGISLWRGTRPNLIVAVGGGSVLDTAKLIGLLGPSMAPCGALFGQCFDQHAAGVPVIAIPTTAGSGAEATRFAVFYVAGEKRSMSHPALRPRHAIVDPLLTVSMPPSLAAATALDAVAQAIESLWAVGATPDSQALAEAALRDILPCLPHIANAPAPALRERMARGAHLAGRAIDLSRTTAAHALSYALTTELGVPHGHAVALTLPAVFQINARPGKRPIRDKRGETYVARTMDRIVRLLDCRDGEDAASFLHRCVAGMGLATRLTISAPGVSAASLATHVNTERLDNNPVVLSAEDVLDIYHGLTV